MEEAYLHLRVFKVSALLIPVSKFYCTTLYLLFLQDLIAKGFQETRITTHATAASASASATLGQDASVDNQTQQEGAQQTSTVLANADTYEL